MTLRLVVMGVSGCGKSSVGAALGARLGIPYRDGDDLHPAANVAKMRAGIALTDDDRWPWLDRVAAALPRMSKRQGHYMPLALLDSQFATLEPPGKDEALTVDIDQPLPALIDQIAAHLTGAMR
ncbi:MAG: hypothetical protein RLZZ563_2623 [Pseudomonadota bacterium]